MLECICAQTRPRFILSSERVLGNGVKNHINSKRKIPSAGGLEEGRTRDAASCRTASWLTDHQSFVSLNTEHLPFSFISKLHRIFVLGNACVRSALHLPQLVGGWLILRPQLASLLPPDGTVLEDVVVCLFRFFAITECRVHDVKCISNEICIITTNLIYHFLGLIKSV